MLKQDVDVECEGGCHIGRIKRCRISARLQKEIKGVELQIKEVEARMQKEIKEVDARLQERVSQLEVSLHQALAAQIRWLIGGLAILGVVLKLADVLIGP